MLKVARERKFRFDTVQKPVNVMDAHFRSFTKKVLPGLTKQNIGVLPMKSMGSGIILKSKTVSAMECLHFAMSQPVSVVITESTAMQILDQTFRRRAHFGQ